MSKRGIEIYSKTKTEKIQLLQEEFHLKSSGCQILTADTVLYAIQRAPDLINLGLEKAAVKVNSAGAKTIFLQLVIVLKELNIELLQLQLQKAGTKKA